MNKEFIIYTSALSSVALKKYHAGIGHEEADLFVKKSFKIYSELGLPFPSIEWLDRLPSSVMKWMTNYLKDKFVSMDNNPKWVSEPSWRFIDEEPMVFINQVTFLNNEIMENKLSTGDVLYTFAGRKYIDEGWELKIKLIKQDHCTPGTTYID